jgi:hypothetical protein
MLTLHLVSLPAFFATAPLTDLVVPNPHGGFTLEGRRGIFSGEDYVLRSLILRKGITDGVLEVFALCVCYYEFILLFFFFLLLRVVCGAGLLRL